MSDIPPLVLPAVPSDPPDERMRAVLARLRDTAERNVKILRSDLHALTETIAEKQQALQHEIGAVHAFAAALEQLGTEG